MPTLPEQSLTTILAEPYAFAVLTWPSVIALLTPLSATWPDSLLIVLMVWLITMQLAAYSGGRGFGFGNAMLLCSGIVALACQAFPSAWTLACLPALLIALHAAQRTRLFRTETPAKPSSATSGV